MKPTCIYLLKDPRDGNVRYVGKSVDLKSRLRQHIHDVFRGVRNHKTAWIKQVLDFGARPIIEVDVIVADGECWKQREIERIAYYRSIGAKLTNSTPGGDAPAELTEEGRRALSEKASKQFGTAEGRRRQSELMSKLCSDPEFVRSRASAARDTRKSSEYRSKLSTRSKAMWAKPGHKEMMSTVRKQLATDPEFISKLSAGVSRAQSDPAVRERIAQRAREAWARPEVRERQVAAIRAAASTHVRQGGENVIASY